MENLTWKNNFIETFRKADFFPPQSFVWLMIEDTISGKEGDLSECVTQTSKFFQTQMIKQKSSLRPNLRVEKKSWMRRRRKNSKVH